MAIEMKSFPQGFRALVIGSSGAIGTALVGRLTSDPTCDVVVGIHRGSNPAIDFDQEHSIAAAAMQLARQAPFHLIINAAGVLHSARFMPEKRLGDLHYEQMLATFRVNAFGPALVVRHFSKLLDSERGVMAVISAKVGSIEDNRLGGWYSYRASKAALNMFLKTAAIEIKRGQANAILIALHPGTVNSRLSQPFRGAQIGRSADEAAMDMLAVIDGLKPTDTGRFFAYDGQPLPW